MYLIAATDTAAAGGDLQGYYITGSASDIRSQGKAQGEFCGPSRISARAFTLQKGSLVPLAKAYKYTSTSGTCPRSCTPKASLHSSTKHFKVSFGHGEAQLDTDNDYYYE